MDLEKILKRINNNEVVILSNSKNSVNFWKFDEKYFQNTNDLISGTKDLTKIQKQMERMLANSFVYDYEAVAELENNVKFIFNEIHIGEIISLKCGTHTTKISYDSGWERYKIENSYFDSKKIKSDAKEKQNLYDKNYTENQIKVILCTHKIIELKHFSEKIDLEAIKERLLNGEKLIFVNETTKKKIYLYLFDGYILGDIEGEHKFHHKTFKEASNQLIYFVNKYQLTLHVLEANKNKLIDDILLSLNGNNDVNLKLDDKIAKINYLEDGYNMVIGETNETTHFVDDVELLNNLIHIFYEHKNIEILKDSTSAINYYESRMLSGEKLVFSNGDMILFWYWNEEGYVLTYSAQKITTQNKSFLESKKTLDSLINQYNFKEVALHDSLSIINVLKFELNLRCGEICFLNHNGHELLWMFDGENYYLDLRREGKIYHNLSFKNFRTSAFEFLFLLKKIQTETKEYIGLNEIVSCFEFSKDKKTKILSCLSDGNIKLNNNKRNVFVEIKFTENYYVYINKELAFISANYDEMYVFLNKINLIDFNSELKIIPAKIKKPIVKVVNVEDKFMSLDGFSEYKEKLMTNKFYLEKNGFIVEWFYDNNNYKILVNGKILSKTNLFIFSCKMLLDFFKKENLDITINDFVFVDKVISPAEKIADKPKTKIEHKISKLETLNTLEKGIKLKFYSVDSTGNYLEYFIRNGRFIINFVSVSEVEVYTSLLDFVQSFKEAKKIIKKYDLIFVEEIKPKQKSNSLPIHYKKRLKSGEHFIFSSGNDKISWYKHFAGYNIDQNENSYHFLTLKDSVKHAKKIAKKYGLVHDTTENKKTIVDESKNFNQLQFSDEQKMQFMHNLKTFSEKSNKFFEENNLPYFEYWKGQVFGLCKAINILGIDIDTKYWLNQLN